ncbi:FAD/NAD(P)-binding domain-containing protein [Mollisia scopiformis]|uniref:FAD/NAD(P)-binding domain-containing protein n=1 Tax=Mollisia scopiformis TaxID=149040 RepID=A0A132B2B3_MOLSC|nr:FAD/NAD(P)-binding domain-containing protein [Mollisia scopiformis]KUJ06461.1 FAD/NAD(P)-binding domain-containing protein [Mollisia scopiformis]
MKEEGRIKSVAIIGAGAAGAITAAAFQAENYFDKIRVFERRETPGGTWIYDPDPKPDLPITPGSLPPDVDPRLEIPSSLPRITAPNQQERYAQTPIYDSLTTNVPDIAMCFSDQRFAYGLFVPHHIPRQYIENYFSAHKLDDFLVLNTTVEDLSKISSSSPKSGERWKLTLRKYDCFRHADVWWEEEFDVVILANGHYSVPFIPEVKGLKEYSEKYPGRVMHSKYYRSPLPYTSQKVLVIGNSASGHDVTTELVSSVHHPVYQSRRSKSRWDDVDPPFGIAWKSVISKYLPDGRIVFEDGTCLDNIDKIIYCTGYKASFPFWNEKANGRPMWDYEANKIIKGYWHTFFQDFENLAIVGLPRVLTFRSFEYQAIALARLYSGRNAASLPSVEVMKRWETETEENHKTENRKFHDVEWETGETKEWLQRFFAIAGLGTLTGEGRIPPVLDKDLVWAIEHLRKYPEPGKGDLIMMTRKASSSCDIRIREEDVDDWEIVEHVQNL